MKIDINKMEYEDISHPENSNRNRHRLEEINELGLSLVGIAQFGIPGIMSGLYIEKIWSYNDSEWESYVKWIKEVIEKYNLNCRFFKFQKEHGIWSDKTFGFNRKPTAPLHHLKEEVQEIIDEPYDIEEYADAFSLLIDASRLAGFDMNDIFKAIEDKFDINQKRKWGNPDKNGVIKHIK